MKQHSNKVGCPGFEVGVADLRPTLEPNDASEQKEFVRTFASLLLFSCASEDELIREIYLEAFLSGKTGVRTQDEKFSAAKISSATLH